jgi:hypothetical protein
MMMMNSEFQRIQEEVVVAYIKGTIPEFAPRV